MITKCTLEGHEASGTKTKSRESALLRQGKMPKTSAEIDSDIVLLQDTLELQHQPSLAGRSCDFCQTRMDHETLIGPFVLNTDRKQALEHELESYEIYKPLRASVKNGGGLYFHQRCLEVNQYVRYDPKSPHQWLNVRTALRNLQQAKVYACFRC